MTAVHGYPLIPSGVCSGCHCFPCRCSMPVLRREPCQCGGWITAYSGERSVTEAVNRHNGTAIHERWAEAAGLR